MNLNNSNNYLPTNNINQANNLNNNPNPNYQPNFHPMHEINNKKMRAMSTPNSIYSNPKYNQRARK
jgi:hypothetical protein